MGEAEVTYEVRWTEQALAELNEIWNTALDKEGIENTAKRIDIELTFRPLEAGESRSAVTRVLVKHPLVVYFQIHSRLPEVLVIHVRCPRHQN